MMDKFIITIGRQIGSGGLETAAKLAEDFGIKMYDKDLMFEAAKSSGISPEFFSRKDEKSTAGSHFFINFRSMLNGAFHGNDSVMRDDRLFQIMSDTMRQIASQESCIFVGRCADYILREHPNILNLFITADLEYRIGRLMKQHSWSEEESRKFIERNEKERAEYYNFYTFRKWGEASNYDICLSSSKLGGTDAVVEAIKYHMSKLNMI